MSKAGKLADIFYGYGRNMLLTMEEDSILLTEGGDNQVFVLQNLLQIENARPDITVYDQKGHLFDQIYGNLYEMTLRSLSAA